QDVRRAVVHGVDVTEVELVGPGNAQGLPCRAAIGGADDRAVGAAGPDDAIVDGADAAEACGHTAWLRRESQAGGRLRERESKQERKCQSHVSSCEKSGERRGYSAGAFLDSQNRLTL